MLYCTSFQVSRIRLNILQYRHGGNITQQRWHIYPTVMWFWVENWLRGVITSYFITGLHVFTGERKTNVKQDDLLTICYVWPIFCCNASVYLVPLLSVDFCVWNFFCLILPSKLLEGKGEEINWVKKVNKNKIIRHQSTTKCRGNLLLNFKGNQQSQI